MFALLFEKCNFVSCFLNRKLNLVKKIFRQAKTNVIFIKIRRTHTHSNTHFVTLNELYNFALFHILFTFLNTFTMCYVSSRNDVGKIWRLWLGLGIFVTILWNISWYCARIYGTNFSYIKGKIQHENCTI